MQLNNRMKLFTKSKATPKTSSKKKSSRHHISPFAVACAAIAVGYIGWRLFTFVGPSGLGMVLASPTKPVELGCSQDVDGTMVTASALPLVSSHYQQYMQRQKPAGANLVKNFSMETVDSDKMPINYYRSTDGDYLVYTYNREASTNVPFLRIETTHKLSDSERSGAWMTDSLAIEKQATYAYSLMYRANVPVIISIEYVMADGSLEYQTVTKLDPQDSWQSFTNYLTNRRDAVSARVIASSRESGQIDTRAYDMHRIADAQLKEGMVSVTFDDGWQSVADKAVPLLNEFDIKTTQYVISEASNKSVAQYMTVDTLKQMKADGHEIGSHTLTHCDQTKLSNEEILANARDSKSTLENDGLGPISSFAYPYGRYDDNTQPLVARAYPLMRSSDVGYNDRYYDERNIRSMVILDTTTDAEVKSWLEYAKTNKVWLVLAYHRVDETGQYSVTSEQLKSQLQLVKDSGLTVKTLSDAASTIR